MTHQVLLIDDDPMVLSGLRRALHDEPFEIHTESIPGRALETIERIKFDVVVSDHDMPGMTGAALLAEVRNIDPTIVRFMLTGKATLDMAITAINDGSIDRFFTKPCNHVDLALTIRGALEGRTLIAEARKLLWLYRRQEAQLEEFERVHPELAMVDRDDTGAIRLDDIPTDGESLNDLLAETFARSEDHHGRPRRAEAS